MIWPTDEQVQSWLQTHTVVEGVVQPAGAGAWSRCWSFVSRGRQLIAKIGPHHDDLRADVHASRWSSPGLPIPQVVDHGESFGFGYVIMDRCEGAPLETADAAEWRVLEPNVVELLEALRLADVTAWSGWGSWNARLGTFTSWDAWLASTATPSERIGPWQEFLRSFPDAAAAFDAGVALLQVPQKHTVPRSLIHGDLLYRNVHHSDGRITGVFDWGCAMYGDHVFDLSWFEFWSPWHPGIDFASLRAALGERWAATRYVAHDFEQRRRLCLLQIGVSHLAWHASQHDEPELRQTLRRLNELDLEP